MEQFLRKRGVEDETLEKMRNQKIDEDAVKGMTDEELAEFLPNKGDRCALRDFVLRGSVGTKCKKSSLMDKLRDRLKSKNSTSSSSDDDPSQSKLPKLNARKVVHSVDLGWYHFDESRNMYIQVREKLGGGKRTLSLDKSMNKRAIIDQCLDLFFPGGESQHGPLKAMTFDLTDFQLKPLPDEETTIGDMIDRAKLQKIRFYLNTRLRNQDSEEEPLPSIKFKKSSKAKRTSKVREGRDAKNSPSASITGHQVSGPSDSSSQVREGSGAKNSPSASTTGQLERGQSGSSNQATSSSDAPSTYVQADVNLSAAHNNVVNNDQLIGTDESDIYNSQLPDLEVEVSSVWEDSLGEVAFTRMLPVGEVRDSREFKIIVHRGHVLKDLINMFKSNPDINFRVDIITCQIILPNGEIEQAYDSGGVLRDILTEFWDDFYDQCTTGNTIKVPCLRHDFEPADWKAVARILAMGWILQNILPIRLAPSFLNSCLYGMTIETDNLREEFLQLVSPSERNIITSAMTNFDEVDHDELLEVLSAHDGKVRPTKENIETVIDQISHMELVQETAFIRECFFEILISYALTIDVMGEYRRMVPTARKLLSILTCNEPDAESYKHLKRYIREIDTDMKMLRTLLRFLTASDMLLYDSGGNYHSITVRITDLEGISRRPIAHTCGRILELPRSYESYNIFKFELNAVLSSNVWVMDLA